MEVDLGGFVATWKTECFHKTSSCLCYSIMTKGSECRIPIALQNVFLESNQGKEVCVPPPEKSEKKSYHEDLPKRRLSPKLFGIASLFAGSPKKKKQAAHVKETSSPRKKVKCFPTLSPQDYLDGMLRSRGYATDRHDSLNTGYYKRTTALQKASYGSYIMDIVKQGDEHMLQQMLKCGISPNPCNDFGESMAHKACRLGNADILKVMLEFGCDLSVADNNGRTVLHEACWSVKPCFTLVEMILNVDVRLLHISDARKCLPLSYVRRECWAEWLQFIESKKEIFWPKRDKIQLGPQEPPELATIKPKSLTVKDPYHSIPIKMATILATKKMSPSEVSFLALTNELVTDSESDSEDSSCDNSEEDDSDGDDYDSEDDSDDDSNDESDDDCDDCESVDVSNAAHIGRNGRGNGLETDSSHRGNIQETELMVSDLLDDSFVLDVNEMQEILNCFNETNRALKAIAWSH